MQINDTLFPNSKLVTWIFGCCTVAIIVLLMHVVTEQSHSKQAHFFH